jgi:hypothetical protein
VTKDKRELRGRVPGRDLRQRLHHHARDLRQLPSASGCNTFTPCNADANCTECLTNAGVLGTNCTGDPNDVAADACLECG